MSEKKSLMPIPKVLGGGVGGAATIVLVWILGHFAHLELPDAVSTALGVLVSVGLAYVIPGAKDNRDW